MCTLAIVSVYVLYVLCMKWTRCAGHKSLMRKIMTPEMFAKYKDVKSSKGFTFSNAIQVTQARCVMQF